jgi:hypothetical protein
MDIRSKKPEPSAQSEDQEDELLSIVAIKRCVSYFHLPEIQNWRVESLTRIAGGVHVNSLCPTRDTMTVDRIFR